jgi:AcrR family transcriptional regulator
MVRVVKPPKVRRSEILDVAQRLFYQKGYEPTSIQDIITDIGIAKGTFYHYFGSKLDLLDAIIERMAAQTLQALRPIVEDKQLSALEKFNQYFAHAENLKVDNKVFFLGILRVWLNDDNAIFRLKLQSTVTQETAGVLATIIEQGIAEGSFTVHYPLETAEILLGISQTFSESVSKIILDGAEERSNMAQVERKITAVQSAIERVLNAPYGSITIFDIERTGHWFDPLAL